MEGMTAFATAEMSLPEGRLLWEVRGVNHRYLDLSLRLPDAFRGIEGACRQYLRDSLRRGKCDISLRYLPDNVTSGAMSIDNERLDALLVVCHQLQQRAGVAAVEPLALLSWPGVVKESLPLNSDSHAQAMALLAQVMKEFCRARAAEGAMIADLIAKRCTLLQAQVDQVRTVLPAVLMTQRQRLLARLEELNAGFDEARLEQEMVILAQRSDVAEELDRLDAHIAEVNRLRVLAEPVGRRLDFLMQELNREANTLASKSLSLATTAAAVEMKVLIEQMREQIQNVE